jgi:hypothetical protein
MMSESSKFFFFIERIFHQSIFHSEFIIIFIYYNHHDFKTLESDFVNISAQMTKGDEGKKDHGSKSIGPCNGKAND